MLNLKLDVLLQIGSTRAPVSGPDEWFAAVEAVLPRRRPQVVSVTGQPQPRSPHGPVGVGLSLWVSSGSFIHPATVVKFPLPAEAGTLIEPNAESRYEITRADLPLSCPMPGMAVWSSHPKVYLPIEETGEAKCPYCGAEFRLIDR